MTYRPYCFLDLETGCIFCDLQAEAEETADDVNITLEVLSIADFTKSRSLRDIDYYGCLYSVGMMTAKYCGMCLARRGKTQFK